MNALNRFRNYLRLSARLLLLLLPKRIGALQVTAAAAAAVDVFNIVIEMERTMVDGGGGYAYVHLAELS